MQVKVIKTPPLSEFAKEFLERLCILNNQYLALALLYQIAERSINEKFKSKRP
jgi:hypothetical protein